MDLPRFPWVHFIAVRGRFPIVADGATSVWLLLVVPDRSKQKPTTAGLTPATCLVVSVNAEAQCGLVRMRKFG